jgi:hypothetical protein
VFNVNASQSALKMNTRESTSGRSYKHILVQAGDRLADSTGLQLAIEGIEPKQSVAADTIVNLEGELTPAVYIEVKPQLTSPISYVVLVNDNP